MDDIWPTWLKAMENGAVGEARSRAFLIDRFWVLERSVDTDGADFLIQRRTTTQRFTDKTPPRVGVIQAKYFQDRRTTHYIPKSYVVDDKGSALEGFFALLHVGKEDSGEMYLLSAQQIINTLSVSASHKPESYIVGTTALAETFRVSNRKFSLNRIEHSLKSQTYLQSAAFFDQLNIPFRKFAQEDIEFDWTLPLPNPVGDIPQMFFEQKEALRNVVFEMEEVLGVIDSILIEKDPRKALQYVEDLGSFVDGYRRISFSSRSDFRWGDFPNALDVHDRWTKALQTDGLLASYVSMGEQLQAALAERAASHPLIGTEDYLEADLEYKPDTFAVTRLTVGSGTDTGKLSTVETSGHVRTWRRLDTFAPRKRTLIDCTVENLWWQIMRFVIEDRYPDPDDD